MRTSSIRFLSIAAVATALSAAAGAQRTIQVADTGATVRNWTEGNVSYSAVSRDGGESWSPLATPNKYLNWRTRSFDPAVGDTAIPANLMANESNELFYVQFVTDIIPSTQAGAAKALGAEAVRYYPHQAYIVRIGFRGTRSLDAVRDQPYVRAVMELELGPQAGHTPIQAGLLDGDLETAALQHHARRQARGRTAASRRASRTIGGVLESPFAADGGIRARGDPDAGAAALTVAHENTVLWIDRWSAPAVSTSTTPASRAAWTTWRALAGIDGKGMHRTRQRGHPRRTHPEFAAHPAVPHDAPRVGDGNESSQPRHEHGRRDLRPGTVSGGLSRASCPSRRWSRPTASAAQPLRHGARTCKTRTSLQGVCLHDAVLGRQRRTFNYTSTSALLDDILFDFPQHVRHQQPEQRGQPGLAPRGLGQERVRHRRLQCTINNTDPATTAGATPAARGRPRTAAWASPSPPTTTASARRASGSGYTNSFGGTSGATPIVNGLAGAVRCRCSRMACFGYPGGWLGGRASPRVRT